MITDIDLGVIIDAIVSFDHEDYGIGINPALDARGGVTDWAIDLAMEIADALEPGGVRTAKISQGDSAVTSFVQGVQEARGTSWVEDLEPE